MANMVRRRLPVWLIALLGAAVALAAIAAFGSSQAQAASDLSVSKTINPKQVVVGQQQVYTINIKNTSGTKLTGVRMRDPLPSGVSFIKARTSQQIPGSCKFVRSSRTVVCGNYTLARGQSMWIKIYVKATKAGQYTNRAFVTHNTAGLTGTPGSARASDAATHRAIKRDGGGQRCGVKAVGGNNGATACVGGVQAGNGSASVGGIQAR